MYKYLLILSLSFIYLTFGCVKAEEFAQPPIIAYYGGTGDFWDQGGGGLDIYQNDKTSKWKPYNNHPRKLHAQNPEYGGGNKANPAYNEGRRNYPGNEGRNYSGNEGRNAPGNEAQNIRGGGRR